eukprot:TRINITY_DN51051_c0_g1_i1.p1 TRINITY_DN51051_c0_g1~~TRINITY_DN51051_c0_g1_i1.p1  ORF type:complete len:362 (+),score=80.61 TRINITY_DN51051_c0_g1_i1:59-1087(+)
MQISLEPTPKRPRIGDDAANPADALARLQAAAQAAIDSVTRSMTGSTGQSAPSPRAPASAAGASAAPSGASKAADSTASSPSTARSGNGRGAAETAVPGAGTAIGLAGLGLGPSAPSSFEPPPVAPPQLAPPGESQAGNASATQMYTLASVAEEASVAAASAAACIVGAESDPGHLAALADAANQAAKRATWAADALATSFPVTPGVQEDEWTRSVRTITQQAANAAEQAAASCRQRATEIVTRIAALEKGKSKVPCKWFIQGQCRKGAAACEFSHDAQDLQPRPLHMKRAVECVHFAHGRCGRGPACPFAHGAEELAQINRVVADLKMDKRAGVFMGARRF